MFYHNTINGSAPPVGSITAYAGRIDDSCPDENFNTTPIEAWGWIVCDGRKLNVIDYPELFAVLGYLYGGSDGEFNIPDLRGMFLRGIGTDEASTESREKAPGGKDNQIGSVQQCAMQKHKHQYKKPVGVMPGKSGSAFASTQDDLTSDPTDNLKSVPGKIKVSDYETRPVNMFVNYIIKYQ
ncbi:MAG: phage tail protein [Bacteroidales bacterium]|jgi:microcystin-dependent protein|nr:phage tail protein [Bacteroidales bacterium]